MGTTFTVNAANYARFNYPVYTEGNVPCKFKVGDVVYNKAEKTIGVVLGCITKHEVRTDADGMQCISDLCHATGKHFSMKGVRVSADLKAEFEAAHKYDKSVLEALEKTERLLIEARGTLYQLLDSMEGKAAIPMEVIELSHTITELISNHNGTEGVTPYIKSLK